MVSGTIYVIFLVLGFFVLVSYWSKVDHLKTAAITKRWLLFLKNVALIFLVATIAASPLYYEYPNYGISEVLTIDRETNEITSHPYGLLAWETEDFVNMPIFPTLLKTDSVKSHVSFITENPKVRTISYKLDPMVIDAKIFCSARSFKGIVTKGVNDELAPLAEYEANEFNNAHSKDLSKFYNPLDPQQQKDFRSMVEGFINSRLKEKGIAVICSNFKID